MWGRPPGAVVRAWCPKRILEDVLMSKGSGVSRSDRRRNARRERLRGLLPRDGAVVGIDLGEVKQALVLVDHDVRVLWRKTARGRAHELGGGRDEAGAGGGGGGAAGGAGAGGPRGAGGGEVARGGRWAGVGGLGGRPR